MMSPISAAAAAGLLMLWEQPTEIAGKTLQQTEEAPTEILSMYNPVKTQRPTNLQRLYRSLRTPGQNSQARSEPLLKASSSGTRPSRSIAWKSTGPDNCKAAATTATTPGEAPCEKTVIQAVTTTESSRKRAIEPSDEDDEGKHRTTIRRTIEPTDDDDEGKERTTIRRTTEPKK